MLSQKFVFLVAFLLVGSIVTFAGDSDPNMCHVWEGGCTVLEEWKAGWYAHPANGVNHDIPENLQGIVNSKFVMGATAPMVAPAAPAAAPAAQPNAGRGGEPNACYSSGNCVTEHDWVYGWFVANAPWTLPNYGKPYVAPKMTATERYCRANHPDMYDECLTAGED